MQKDFIVKLLTSFGNGLEKITVKQGTSLRQVLETFELVTFEEYLMKVSGEVVDQDYLLQPDDYVVITPRKVEGAAPTCELRKLKKYLKDLGWVQEAGTVGDHENWRSPEGLLLQLNPAKLDSKVADLASHKKCATILGINFQTLYETVASHR